MKILLLICLLLCSCKSKITISDNPEYVIKIENHSGDEMLYIYFEHLNDSICDWVGTISNNQIGFGSTTNTMIQLSYRIYSSNWGDFLYISQWLDVTNNMIIEASNLNLMPKFSNQRICD